MRPPPRLDVVVGVLVSVVLAVVCAPRTLLADTSKTDQDRAERLFQDGKALMAATRFEEACLKLQESERIDPAIGTLLALALCHEGQGRLATAYREFKQALPAVQLDKRRDREAFVSARLKELGPRVPKLVVVVEGAALADPTLALRVDGESIPRASWGADLMVDAGEHRVDATGRGKPRHLMVVLSNEHPLRRLAVPALESDAPPPIEPPPSRPSSRPRALGIVLVGLGVASIGVGSLFGVRAIQKSDEAKGLCDPAACADPRAIAINDDAKSAAMTSTVAMVFGGAAMVGGGVVWFTSRRSASLTAAPAFGAGQVGFRALARF